MARIGCRLRCLRWKIRRCSGVRSFSITSRSDRASGAHRRSDRRPSRVGASAAPSASSDLQRGSVALRKRRFTVLRVMPKIHTSRVDFPSKLSRALKTVKKTSWVTSSASAGSPQALQREAVDPREVALVEHLEVFGAAGQDLGDELGVVRPGPFLALRHCVLQPLISRADRRGTSRTAAPRRGRAKPGAQTERQSGRRGGRILAGKGLLGGRFPDSLVVSS